MASRKRPTAGGKAEPPVLPKTKSTGSSAKSKQKAAGVPSVIPKGTSSVYARKPTTLFDDLDSLGTSPSSAAKSGTASELRGVPKVVDGDEDDESDDDDEDDSSLTSLSDSNFFESVLGQGRAAKDGDEVKGGNNEDGDDSNDDDDEDIEFEDVHVPHPSLVPQSLVPSTALGGDDGGDSSLELTLHRDTRISLTNPYGDKTKKGGPTKVERLVRSATHCVHVQTLLWHNARRNGWLCDGTVQGLLLSHLPPSLWKEVERWRRASGLEVQADREEKQERPAKRVKREHSPPGAGPTTVFQKRAMAQQKAKAKQTGRVGDKTKEKRPARESVSRDWGSAAKQLEKGVVDMSHGDPLFRLMRALSAWWKQRFRMTAPGLRKTGYMTLERLDRLLKSYQGTAAQNKASVFGERVADLAAFREHAAQLHGSRDVGAQLFTALLRGLGLEVRMVASLQPLGFGWSKMEDADPEPDDDALRAPETRPKAASTPPPNHKSTEEAPAASGRRQRVPGIATAKAAQPHEPGFADVNSDNESAVALSDLEAAATPKRHKAAVFDADLAFPHYWSEVLSPVTGKYVAVDALIKQVVATNRELVESLEPRGGKAERARQVMAYVVGYAADGTAKDVTVRYLKRQTLPGRTRGVRMAPERVAVHDRHGRVKRYDAVDWFGQRAMRGYVRGNDKKHPLTEADEAEDAGDLRPARAEQGQQPRAAPRDGEETLQYYKQSTEFVLERHLKREEALVAGAVPVKVFRAKKAGGRDTNNNNGENVYRRADVVAVKSAETWHKQGRVPRAGEAPLKRVAYRAATLNRRREVAEAEAATGAPVLQGLYSWEQTEWIVPAPIRDGVIPKNEYGNIDLFVEHMLPRGAAHIPFRGALRVCRRLQVDCAEAVVDFEFGHRMAVPVIQGVVVAQEHRERVLAELARDERERERREDAKRRAAALALWRKMLMGLRVVERIRQDYGELPENEHIFGSSHAVVNLDSPARDGGGGSGSGNGNGNGSGNGNGDDDDDMAGGFLPHGYEYCDEDRAAAPITSSFFPVHDDEADGDGPVDVVMEAG